jgi:carboxyl-terminal processing protease
VVPAVLLTVVSGVGATDPGTYDPATFSEVWTLVRDHFYDPELRGLDWEAVRTRYSARAASAGDAESFATVVNAMLAELETSHTRYYNRSDPAYYQLMAIFYEGLGEEAKRWFPDGVRYPTAGLITEPFEDAQVIRAVLDGSPGRAAGLRAGDRILAADDRPFRPIASLHDTQEVVLTVERDGERTVAVVRPETVEPNEQFARALEQSARAIHASGRRLAYVHVWSWAGLQYQRTLESLLAGAELGQADGLILDLREGWGGASPEYLHMFDCTVPGSSWIGRDGKEQHGFRCWDRPVALLVNEKTRSGKEWFAYGFKAFDRGPVVGTRTAGAVTAGRAFVLGDGNLLIVAVADVRIDGVRLEGRGVEPDVPVPFDPRTGGGEDPQLDRAVRELLERLPEPTAQEEK